MRNFVRLITFAKFVVIVKFVNFRTLLAKWFQLIMSTGLAKFRQICRLVNICRFHHIRQLLGALIFKSSLHTCTSLSATLVTFHPICHFHKNSSFSPHSWTFWGPLSHSLTNFDISVSIVNKMLSNLPFLIRYCTHFWTHLGM